MLLAVWQSLGVYFALVALRVLLNYLSVRHYLRLPLVERVAVAPELPSVSIVIPARDEEANLGALLESLKALEYPRFETVVVDDASTDRTAEIATSYGATLVSVNGPPAGWTGKNFACWTGANAATGDWLLFADADTTHQPASLQQAISFAFQEKAKAVSLFLQQRCFTFWEQVLLPFAYQQYFISVPTDRVNAPGDPQALANGQYILIEREAYFRAGGHEAVKGQVVDDVALARRLKAAGVPIAAARGERLASVRMYRGLGEIWAGFGKNAVGFLRQRGVGGVWTVLGTILSGLAIPCAVYGLATHSLQFELAAVVTYFTAVMELTLWNVLFVVPLTYALFQPLAVVVFLAIALTSATGRHFWKGRRI